ncbi:DUF7490 domain-containing protein [Haloterrigena alkaliphila]|uniref:PGF-CTERM sorting domain-containing protein n=1 Tax=Haloterrigena alkaliphila TaxID=2816475 RepID=A0A8A2VGW3_9EURY|nr:PGF-CTERM sorting domain-containing protein [Haloterrigena alkaliphila]QSW99930.1 PGF-CTERM sorting domain-containing protein [Haloterrigena alkaliphila]
MNREYVLAIAALVVVVGALSTLALTGAVSSPDEPETDAAVESGGEVSLTEITISADEITGGTASLAVDTHLEHRGAPVENVTVVHRVTDTKTGLVEDTTERPVETLEDESERVVSSTVAVPRESSYEIETFVYRDGSRIESARQTIDGVDALTPAYADTDVEFHRFGSGPLADVPAIEYSVASTTDDRATLDVSTYLTNTGDEPESGLELEVKARQSESNIVADTATADLSTLEPGTTASPSVDLEVPQEYDYYLDAVLWRDGTIVATDRAVANLGPGALSLEETSDEGGLEVGDFSGADGADRESAADDGARTDDGADEDSSEDGTPGFGVAAAAVALLATIALARRNT